MVLMLLIKSNYTEWKSVDYNTNIIAYKVTLQIKFKVDGKTMIFAHGLEFNLEKICFTFKWNEEQRVKDFFEYLESCLNYADSFLIHIEKCCSEIT